MTNLGGGALVEVTIGSRVSVLFEPSINGRGTKWQEASQGTLYDYDAAGRRTSYAYSENLGFRHTTRYLDLPVLVKYSLTGDRVRLYGLAGPTISLLKSAWLDVARRIDTQAPPTTFWYFGDFSSTDAHQNVQSRFSGMEVSAAAGLGVSARLGAGQFFVEGDYSIGMTSISQDFVPATASVKNSGFRVRAGVTYSMRARSTAPTPQATQAPRQTTNPRQSAEPGEMVRLIAPPRIEVPGLITLEEGKVDKHVPYEKMGEVIVLHDGKKIIHLPQPGHRLRGTFVSMSEDSVTLRQGDQIITVPRLAIAGLEVRHETSRARRGALLGGILGFAAAFALDQGTDPTWTKVVWGLAGAAPGGVIGGWIDARGDRWQPIALPAIASTTKVGAAYSLRPGKASAAIGVRF